MRASDVLPSDLAIGLTLPEGDELQQVSPSDYVGGHPVPNAAEAAKQVNDQIVKWVQKSVLHSDDVLQRTEVMTFFLNAAKVRTHPRLLGINLSPTGAYIGMFTAA